MAENKTYRRAYLGGTFDCLHRGHLALFAGVRQIANELVVSLNTDEFAERYKRRPLMPLADRVAVLEQCSLVDQVVVNVGDEDSKVAIVSANVDCIIHGDDWVGTDLMRQMGFDQTWLDLNGISLVILPYTKITCTTGLLKAYEDNNAEVRKIDQTVTTCATCNRAINKTDVDADRNCSTCSPYVVHVPTETEWADLGRPEEKA